MGDVQSIEKKKSENEANGRKIHENITIQRDNKTKNISFNVVKVKG